MFHDIFFCHSKEKLTVSGCTISELTTAVSSRCPKATVPLHNHGVSESHIHGLHVARFGERQLAKNRCMNAWAIGHVLLGIVIGSISTTKRFTQANL